MPSNLLTLAAAAERFGVSESTLYRAIRAGKLKRWKRHGDVRSYVDRDELEELLRFRHVEHPRRERTP